MIVSFLGVVKSGHAYLPIEEHTPKERILSIFRVAKPSMVISIGDWIEDIPSVPVITKRISRNQEDTSRILSQK